MKKYEITIIDFDEGVFEGIITVENVESLDVKSITDNYTYYTDILINSNIKIKVPGEFVELVEITDMKVNKKDVSN